METKWMRNVPGAARILSGLALVFATTFALADDTITANRVAAIDKARADLLVGKWCSACHGYNGQSVNPIFPTLAGQSAEYLVAQLKFFHNLTQDDRNVTHETYTAQWIINITGLRRNERYENAPRNEARAWDFMKGVARDLDEPTMQNLADYFSKQTPMGGRVTDSHADIARGKTLYLDGDASKGLIACQMCHGPDAKGQGPIPRLAGQHADYVSLQLRVIQSGLRNVEQMQALIANLSDADFAAVAAYVQSLN
jgi:cytochrome c553